MWPTFADGSILRTPSTIPSPARRIATIATEFSFTTVCLHLSSGVSTSTSTVGMSLKLS